MRHSHGVQHAVLGVVSRNPEGIHGYAVRRQGERLLGHFWRLNFGEVYRILDRLSADGLIEQVADGSESARKVYRITADGARAWSRAQSFYDEVGRLARVRWTDA